MKESTKSLAKSLFTTRAALASAAVFRRIRRRGGLRVINFHRVLSNDLPLNDYRRGLGFPTVREFDQLIGRLAREFAAEDLAQFVSRPRKSDDRAIRLAVTFDDGYEDNLTNALPVLERYGVPATVFVTVDAINGTRLWFQRLYLLVAMLQQPHVRVPWDPRTFSLTDRVAVIDALASSLKQLPIREVHQQLDDLESLCECNCNPKEDDPEKMLTWDQLSYLAGHPLITIGGHTMTHPNLTLLTDSELDLELVRSFQEIQLKAGCVVSLLAYPNGRYDERIASKAKQAGYSAAFTMSRGINRPGADPYTLHREYLPLSPSDAVVQLAGFGDAYHRLLGRRNVV